MITTKEKAPAPEETQKCKVLKAFFLKGKPVEVDSAVELPLSLAHELKSCNKVKFVSAKAKEASEPAPRKTTN